MFVWTTTVTYFHSRSCFTISHAVQEVGAGAELLFINYVMWEARPRPPGPPWSLMILTMY